MKQKLSLLAMCVSIMACSSLKKWQSFENQTLSLGVVGETTDDVFTKSFREVGQPKLSHPITVDIQSVPFTKASFHKYKKYKDQVGEPMFLEYNDSLESVPRFFKLRITDFVHFKEAFNSETNEGMLEYLMEDASLKLLTEVSLVADTSQEPILNMASLAQLIQKGNRFYLEVKNKGQFTEVHTHSFEIFDFETAGFCWQLNQRHKAEIATILENGQACSKGTENKAKKLDDTFNYLKL
jgi:hypothetical protein